MAEDQDQSQKTEEPTQKRLDEAHKKGEVGKSQEIKHWFMIGGGALALTSLAYGGTARLGGAIRPYLESPHDIAVDASHIQAAMWGLLGEAGAVLLLPFLILIAAAIAGNMIQHKPMLSLEKVKPSFGKLSPLKGFQRLFSAHTMAEFVKSLIKLVIVGSVAVILVWPERDRLGQMMTYDMAGIVSLVWTLSMRLFLGVLAVLGVIAGGDYLFQRLQFLKRLRMTKQEIKDEYKQTEGDPVIRSRIRQLRMERARRRMMAAVPKADVVVTNPTHVSVALKYDVATMPAPRVVAKGVDAIALKIREVAKENNVPLVENPPLARALYATVELDQEIPTEHYKAVAEVIGYVMRLKNPKRPRRRAP